MALGGASETRKRGVSATAPLDRLSPADFYRQLDWIRDEWESTDEWAMSRKLSRLRSLYEHLPERHWKQAEQILTTLGLARLVRGSSYANALRQLADIVREWDRARPPLLDCPECGIQIRGHRPLATHRYVVHDVEDGQ